MKKLSFSVFVYSDIVYQQSFEQKSKFDEAVKHIFQYGLSKDLDKDIYKHRELAGNDENVFDSVGYKIPAGTLMRSPFLQYHLLIILTIS